MEDGVDAESVGMLFGEAHAAVADAQAQFAGLSLESHRLRQSQRSGAAR
jgi:hypothetical protein